MVQAHPQSRDKVVETFSNLRKLLMAFKMENMAYQIQESKIEPIIITSTFMSFLLEPQSLYVKKLDEWCKDKVTDVEAYFPIFCNKLESLFQVGIYFDNRILEAVKKLLKNNGYLEFTAQNYHQSPLKMKLKQVIRVLTIYGFISHSNCQVLLNKMSNNYFKDKIEKYLGLVDQVKKRESGKVDGKQISRIWKQTLKLSFQQTWAFLQNNKIYEPIIIEFHEASKPLIRQYSIQRMHSIDQYIEAIKANIAQRNRNPMLLQWFSQCNDPKKNLEYSDAMDKYITRHSLVFNDEKLKLANEQIRRIVSIIKNGVSFGNSLTFQLFGSMKTGFALLQESDGDIEITIPNQASSRQRKIQYLEAIYAALSKSSQGRMEFADILEYFLYKIKNPFIKVKYFNKDNKGILRTIDLVINTPQNIKNTKVIQLYSKNDYIIKFCNFVKLWAKKKQLIDSKSPKQSLTSYAIQLMALFYLIKTNQAPLIVETTTGQFHLQKNLMEPKQYSCLFDNFKGFLEFYRFSGRFFKENMVVCLKESFVQTPYTRKYLVNIHDVVDHTNAGRIDKQLTKKFFSIINNTYLQLISYQSLNEILRYEPYKHSNR